MAQSRVSKHESDVERYRRFTLSEPRTANAYVAFVGLDGMESLALVEKLEQGLPYAAFERLQKTLSLTAGEFAKVLGIPARTLARRKVERRLTLEESDRLARVARAFAHAVDVYEGDADLAAQWMRERIPVLGGKRPIDLLATEVGAVEVDRTLGQLEHGIVA